MDPAAFTRLFEPALAQLFDVHARALEYKPGDNADWQPGRGIWNPAYKLADADANTPIMTQERILDLRASEIGFTPDSSAGHQVKIDGDTFDVIEVLPRNMIYRVKVDKSRY